jgi:AcrR family transcriptional regulator
MAHIPAEQRKQEFIEAAVRVIAEQGVRGATTRKIAEAADAPLATLHYCFQTKENLFFAVFQHLAEELVVQPADEASGMGMRDTAVKLMTNTMDWTVAHDDYARAQYDLYLWAMRQEGKEAGLAVQVYDLFIDQFSQVLKASLRPGENGSLVKPLSRVMLAMLDGLTMQWNGHHDKKRLRADLDLARDMIDAFLVKSEVGVAV